MITQDAVLGPGVGGLGAITLPVVGTLRAMQALVSHYVKEQTGVSLDGWTNFVASSTAQFEAYFGQLDTVAQLTQRHHAPAESEIDVQQARDDEELLLDVRWRTQAWKQILSRVARLGQLVDAVLKLDLRGEPGLREAGALEKWSGFPLSLQRLIKEVQNQTVEKSGDLREWVLQPFAELREGVKQLPGQIEQLSRQIALLEVLLDLEIAEIRACLGEIPLAQARLVGLRVAASIILPELARQLADARQQALVYEAYLDRLQGARSAGDVDDRAYSILSEEYRVGMESSRARRATLEAQAEVWRQDGQVVLDACADWVHLELYVLAARRVVEQREAPDGPTPSCSVSETASTRPGASSLCCSAKRRRPAIS